MRWKHGQEYMGTGLSSKDWQRLSGDYKKTKVFSLVPFTVSSWFGWQNTLMWGDY